MSDTIPILAVSGRPVLHSMSPVLFRALFRASSVDAAYVRVAASSAEEAIGLFRSLGLRGMNLTAPFKEPAASLADELTPEARELGAVNCLLRTDGGKALGANTDMQGVIGALRGRGVDVAGRRCLVLGAGGAGKAASRALARSGGRVVVVNRTLARAEELARAVGGKAAGLGELAAEAREAEVIVSTLAASALPDPITWLPPSGSLSGRSKRGATDAVAVLDADYKRGELARIAAERGFTVAGGLEWLACQAKPAYELFMGEPAAETDLAAAARAAGHGDRRDPRSLRVALVGLMGAGKSATGKALAQALSARFIDADDEIERETGMTVPEIFASEGESAFRSRELRIIDRLTSMPGPMVIATGGGAPATAAGPMLAERCLGVWLHVRPETALERASAHGLGSRPMLSGADPLAKLITLESERRGAYALCSELVVSTEGRDAIAVARMIHDEIDRLS